jgi:molecular chaperone DnaK
VDPILSRLRSPVEQALKDAGVDARKIDEVVLVGGSTRIPKVQEIVKEMFGKEPNKSVNPTRLLRLVRQCRLVFVRRERQTFCCSM